MSVRPNAEKSMPERLHSEAMMISGAKKKPFKELYCEQRSNVGEFAGVSASSG